ncbi:hypothetical protein C9446_11170 [Providencia heimbachae]|nr:hypothetical protein C9446_11170 [Providencia heimbachae]
MNNQRMIDRGIASICFDVSVLGVSSPPPQFTMSFFITRMRKHAFSILKMNLVNIIIWKNILANLKK